MYIHSKLIAASSVLAFCASCTNFRNDVHDYSVCKLGNMCRVEGLIDVLKGTPYSVATITRDKSCIALALDEEKYNFYYQRKGISVKVSGKVYSYLSADSVVSLTIFDRLVATGACQTGKIIYVDYIEEIGLNPN
jgi:hypothetical protein